MIWTIIILVIVFILVKFLIELSKDKNDLEGQPLEVKFNVIINAINEAVFNGHGKITKINNREFNLYEVGKNQLVKFQYSTGSLSLIWRQKYLGREIVCEKDFTNIRNTNENFQKEIAKSFLKQIDMKIKANESVKIDTPLTTQSAIDGAKFKMNALFYQFCFSVETAKMFLEENDMRPTISRALYLSVLESNKFLELTFKLFLKKRYGLEFETIGYKFYRYNGYKFFLDVDRIDIDEEVTFFEILRNGFENVKDADGNDCAIAHEFIVYVKDTLPVAIFIIVVDPLINKIAVREVFKDGQSSVIKFFNSNDDNEAIDFLKDFVSKK
jgi:hypothetical protein